MSTSRSLASNKEETVPLTKSGSTDKPFYFAPRSNSLQLENKDVSIQRCSCLIVVLMFHCIVCPFDVVIGEAP